MIRAPNYWEWSLEVQCWSPPPTAESRMRGFGPGGRLTERIRELAGILMTEADYLRVADALLDDN